MIKIENDGERLAHLLASTLQAQSRKQAEEDLSQFDKVPGFTPVLLQLIMSEQIEMPVRQAGMSSKIFQSKNYELYNHGLFFEALFILKMRLTNTGQSASQKTPRKLCRIQLWLKTSSS
jgi:hypothetical protein